MVVVAEPQLRRGYAGAAHKASSTQRLRDHHPRINRRPGQLPPEGWYKCPIPSCNGLVKKSDDLGQSECCTGAEQHEIDFETECRAFMPTKTGGFTRSGLTMTQQGELAEEIIKKLGRLGKYGRVTIFDEYNCPLDGFVKHGSTELRWGLEIKSCSTKNHTVQFCPGNRETKHRKDAFARENDYCGILGILVVLDYETSMADIYVVEMEKIRYYYPKGEPFLSDILFDNPFVEKASEPLPF